MKALIIIILLTVKGMSDLNKADSLQAIFDDLPTTHKEYWQAYQTRKISLGDIEDLVNVLYDSELI